jgi:hypothetical protein
MVVQTVYILVGVGIALLVVLKKPGQWVPLGLACGLIAFTAYEGVDFPALATAHPALTIPLSFLDDMGMGPLGLYANLTFPNGRFGSRWLKGLFIVVAGVELIGDFTSTSNVSFRTVTIPDTVFLATAFAIFIVILIYRNRHILSPEEQPATKWLILGDSMFILWAILLGLLYTIVPANSFILVCFTFGGFFGCGINIAGTLMAVLISNVFDIDILVRRTLIYTLLTASLVLVYVGLVFGSRLVLHGFRAPAAQSPVIIVGSTLVVAALFEPLRRSIQTLIDRRFYRQKYDARRAMERFSSSLQGSADLAEISDQLLAVVTDTMQPSQVSLWLRTPTTAHTSTMLVNEPE